jgi:predicted AAA+ superfamily ATPase
MVGNNTLPRLLKLPQNESFFLFGARNTGKSTLLHKCFSATTSLWVDLLDPEEEDRFSRNPNELKEIVLAMSSEITHVIIDEVQKVPKLLDVVHSLIESTKIHFVMTGSSARKLKHGGANLLAGRAYVYNLFPFSFLEIDKLFNLSAALQWGLLPRVVLAPAEEQKAKFLQAYSYTYLKEEIWVEQFIRKIDPFRRFLEVAAQCNSKIINFANIARNVGVDDKTIKEYFSILEDTLIGFFLEPFQNSLRKRLSAKPKFYFFDTGVVRALARLLSVPIRPETSAYGEAFEHFVILECFKLANYFKSEYRFSYLKTKDDAEIDLVIERPGEPLLFIEIKSAININREDLGNLIKLSSDAKNCEAVCFANVKRKKAIDNITIYPWADGVKHFFGKD